MDHDSDAGVRNLNLEMVGDECLVRCRGRAEEGKREEMRGKKREGECHLII